MKPTDWAQLPKEEQTKMAIELFKSIRGKYIIGQAFAVAIETLSKEKYPETSNIEDMEMMGETVFEPFFTICKQINKEKKS